MKKEIERIKILLGLNYFIHEEMYSKSSNGYINKEEALKVMWRNHNIPKQVCPIIIKSLEILGLLVDEEKYFKIIKPKKEGDELVFGFKKKLNMLF